MFCRKKRFTDVEDEDAKKFKNLEHRCDALLLPGNLRVDPSDSVHMRTSHPVHDHEEGHLSTSAKCDTCPPEAEDVLASKADFDSIHSKGTAMNRKKIPRQAEP